MSAIERSEPSSRTDTPPLSGVGRQVEREETVLLEWNLHLLRQDPNRIWVVAAAMFLAAGIGFLFFFSFTLAALGALLVLTAAAEYLLPIRYRLTTERAMVSYGLAQLDMRWSNVKRIMEGPGAFKLSPFAKESRLDGIRGVTLRWMESGAPDREALHRIIKERVAAHRPPVAESADA